MKHCLQCAFRIRLEKRYTIRLASSKLLVNTVLSSLMYPSYWAPARELNYFSDLGAFGVAGSQVRNHGNISWVASGCLYDCCLVHPKSSYGATGASLIFSSCFFAREELSSCPLVKGTRLFGHRFASRFVRQKIRSRQRLKVVVWTSAENLQNTNLKRHTASACETLMSTLPQP